MKTLQWATVVITIIHSRQICTINHKTVGFQKMNSETSPKKENNSVQYSIPVVHSTVCTYPILHIAIVCKQLATAW